MKIYKKEWKSIIVGNIDGNTRYIKQMKSGTKRQILHFSTGKSKRLDCQKYSIE